MTSVTVRAHLPDGGPAGEISLQQLWDAEEERAGVPPGPSLRSLLEGLRSSRLQVGRLRFRRRSYAGLDPLATALRQVTGVDLRTEVRLRLELWLDGEYETSAHLRVTESGVYELPSLPAVLFSDRAVVRLYEESVQSGLSHPLVRPVLELASLPTVSSARTVAAEGSQVLEFQGMGGTYELEASTVRQLGRPPTAQELIQRFRASTRASPWRHLDRPTLADQLEETVARPETIRQGPTPLCGPASVVHLMAKRAPRRFVRAVTELYERGRFRTKTGVIDATASLMDAPVPHDPERLAHRQIRQIDWIIAAAMRNSENRFFTVEGGTQVAGITVTSEMVTWLHELLGYERIVVSRATSSGELGFSTGALLGVVGLGIMALDVVAGYTAAEALADGSRSFQRGGEAVMLVNHSLLDEEVRDPDLWTYLLPNVATHWVALREPGPGHPINITHGGEVQFDAFTWGVYLPVRVSTTAFERHTFLVVTAEEGPVA
jgi:hypothetical protein